MTGSGRRDPNPVAAHNPGPVAAGLGEAPSFAAPTAPHVKIRAPEGQFGTLRRRRLEEAVAFADGSHRTTVVSAPAGYGKTTLLGDWSRGSDVACAWLTLDPSDSDPGNLYRWIVASLQTTAANLPGPARGALMGLDPRQGDDPPEAYRRVARALESLSEPMALVIDDVHLGGSDLDGGLLGTLVASGPARLHLVLASRGDPALSLAAHRIHGTVTDIRADALGFTREETCDLMSMHGFDGEAEGAGLWGATAGWPVAITEGLVLRGDGSAPADAFSPEPRRAFLEYVAEEVLARCPDSIADFVLRATTRDTVGRQLAIALQGDAEGSMLLEHCLRHGFFLQEERVDHAEATYRWQPLFATACRAIVSQRDPLFGEELHRRAARHYRDVDVRTCVAEALLGREPKTAVRSIGEHWLEMVFSGATEQLEELCVGLPFPWSEDPEILQVRSACRALAGDQAMADALGRRASAAMGGLGAARHRRLEVNHDLFELFVLGGVDPAAASRAGMQLVDRATEHPTATLASGLFLLGRAESRSARPGRDSADLLQAATAAGRANGLITVEVCAAAELALAYSLNGDFAAAEEQGTVALDQARAVSWPCRERIAPVWVARGMAGYWQDDLGRADLELAEVMDLGSDPFPADSLPMVYRVLVDCASGDPARIAASALALEAFDRQGSHDAAWPALGAVAAAKLREAVGDIAGAAVIVRPLAKGGVSPLTDALVAELLRKAGEPEKALVCAEALAGQQNAPYIEASGALTEALIAHSAGDPAAAHERLEYAVQRAEPESILRPFVERRSDLLQLLVQHAAWGTAHDAFVASTLAQHPPEHVQRRQHISWTLSEREREILSYMRSMLTAAEIADTLFISVNTLKTHQRSIYRKLGVTSRRSAVRIAAARGLI